MALGLVLRVYGEKQPADHTFRRPPVLIGREPGPSRCVLDDPRVSKVHASVDIRGGSLWVRDAGSTNGTFVGGQRLEPNKWIAVGSVQHPAEVRVSTWRIQVFACEVDLSEASLRSGTLGELLEGGERARGGGTLSALSPAPAAEEEAPRTVHLGAPNAPSAAPEPQKAYGGTFDMRAPVAQLAPSYARMVATMTELYAGAIRELDAMPPAARPHVCQQLIAAYPILASDPSFQSLFRHYGFRGSLPKTPIIAGEVGGSASGGALATASLDALQDLAGWYLGRSRPLSREAEVTAFKDKIRAALDELIVGYVPLLSGMMRFEHQMALRADAPSALPTSPTEMAARLLDWNDRGDDLVLRLRASFADLMLHQVALLNGVMSGVKALLTELAPKTIEKAAARDRGRRGWLSRVFSRVDPWELYQRRHSDLADEENERFRLLFGAEFADEYRQFIHEAKDAGEARPQAVFPSAPPPAGALPPGQSSPPRPPTVPPAAPAATATRYSSGGSQPPPGGPRQTKS